MQGAAATIGLQNTSAVKVEVKKRDTAGNLVSISCSPATNLTTSTVVPCSGVSEGESIYVKATFDSNMSLPFAPPPISAHGEGEFRCEFN